MYLLTLMRQISSRAVQHLAVCKFVGIPCASGFASTPWVLWFQISLVRCKGSTDCLELKATKTLQSRENVCSFFTTQNNLHQGPCYNEIIKITSLSEEHILMAEHVLSLQLPAEPKGALTYPQLRVSYIPHYPFCL